MAKCKDCRFWDGPSQKQGKCYVHVEPVAREGRWPACAEYMPCPAGENAGNGTDPESEG